jgi:hypothetical protein
VDLGAFPPVPWTLAALFLFAPLTMLLMVAPMPALALIALSLLAPVIFARFDR